MTTPNIGPQGIRQRGRIGGGAMLGGVALVALLVATGAAPAWRVAAFPLFWLGALGWLQARERT